MKTKEEILSKVTGLTVDSDMVLMQTEIHNILNAMEQYADERVKLLAIHDVRLSLPKNTEIVDRSKQHYKDPNINNIDISEFSFRAGAMWVNKWILKNEA